MPRKLSNPQLLFWTECPVTHPRVEPPQRSARLAKLARKDEEEIMQEDGPERIISIKTCSIAQESMFACADVMQLTMSTQKLAGCKFPFEMINTVLNKETGELMEYLKVTKNPKYRKLYEKSYSKELRRITQGILGQSEDIDTFFLID